MQLVLASLVVTFMGVDGQSADYDPLYIGKNPSSFFFFFKFIFFLYILYIGHILDPFF